MALGHAGDVESFLSSLCEMCGAGYPLLHSSGAFGTLVTVRVRSTCPLHRPDRYRLPRVTNRLRPYWFSVDSRDDWCGMETQERLHRFLITLSQILSERICPFCKYIRGRKMFVWYKFSGSDMGKVCKSGQTAGYETREYGEVHVEKCQQSIQIGVERTRIAGGRCPPWWLNEWLFWADFKRLF